MDSGRCLPGRLCRHIVRCRGRERPILTEDLAWQMIRTAYKCSSDLQLLLRALQESCPPDEYRDHARPIAASIATLNTNLVERALAAHPELAQRIESDITNYGRLTE